MDLSKNILKLEPSATLALTAKVNELTRQGKKIISFGTGEPDFDTPNEVREFAKKAIDDGHTHYTHVAGTHELRKAIVNKFKNENNIEYSVENILVSNGAKQSLYNAFRVILDDDDEVILSSPYWVSYSEMIKICGAKSVFVETKYEEGFTLKAEEIEKKITNKTKALIINTPSNPTGCIIEEEELRKIADLAVKHNIFIIADEIYEKLSYGAKHFSIASISEEVKKRTITINGVSKAYAMTGWRIGYMAASKEIIKYASILQGHSTSNANSIAQMAALKALEMKNDDIEKMRLEFEKRRNYMYQELSKIKGFKLPPKPEGAFYIFINIEDFKMTSIEFAEYVLEKVNVGLVPGIAFGMEGFVRLSYANSMEEIKEGMERLKKISL